MAIELLTNSSSIVPVRNRNGISIWMEYNRVFEDCNSPLCRSCALASFAQPLRLCGLKKRKFNRTLQLHTAYRIANTTLTAALFQTADPAVAEKL